MKYTDLAAVEDIDRSEMTKVVGGGVVEGTRNRGTVGALFRLRPLSRVDKRTIQEFWSRSNFSA